MNTYSKFVPNVFLAKCTEKHEKGETIQIETKYGKEHDCIVFNLIAEKEGFYYYSIVRADGFEKTKVRWEKIKIKLAHNGSRLCAGGALKHETFNPPLNLNRITNDEFSR